MIRRTTKRGAIVHMGEPCERCGSAWRYTANNECVTCATMRALRSQVRRLRAHGEAVRYEGTPCRTCGGVERYTSTGACTVCHAASKRRWYARQHEPARPSVLLTVAEKKHLFRTSNLRFAVRNGSVFTTKHGALQNGF